MLWCSFGHCWLSLAALLVVGSCEKAEHRRGTESSSTGGSGSSGASSSNYSNRRLHRIQHGQCTYTFILPEGEGGRGASCREAKASGVQHNANSLQRDAPPPDADFPSQKIQQLEHIMENYTQWLQRLTGCYTDTNVMDRLERVVFFHRSNEKRLRRELTGIENYIKESMKMEMAQLQQNAVHNHTAAMLEMGTNLLSQTAEQTRKLTDVETQVLNQTSRLEIQLLENSLSTNKLEKELMIQTSEISKLHDKNSFYHHQAFDSNEDEKIYSLEYKETEMLHNKEQNFTSGQMLYCCIVKQQQFCWLFSRSLRSCLKNARWRRERAVVMENSCSLLSILTLPTNLSSSKAKGVEGLPGHSHRPVFLLGPGLSCGDEACSRKKAALQTVSPRYKALKVYCNMESAGGGWTVIQRREDGSVDFQRTWKEYKTGFGTVTAEHWLGNEYVYQLTSQRQYALRVELTDWEGHQAFSLYDRFQIGIVPNSTKVIEEEKKVRDCADLYQAGIHKNGLYTIHISPQETKKGFGTVTAEHWLGNEYVYQLTSQRQYALRVELTDWEGHQAFSLYDRFQIGSEKQNYRLFLKSHSGTAGRQSSLVIHGADFSTKDIDNDNCMCKCALMLTGGWWFDACGPSNLNGMYFTQGQHIGKLNGIKWHYFKGPSYSLRATAMMIRPLDFS
ncbi:unnamed protein product [Tetraodon nigroviridis]|uniref:(spotted green pufferfish) hypothetical protein n=1 Tax=Tetraodon nigroviridis TaxID=99883 RepID=Q4RKJ4_TETNG|nr:unnamed protein product [Tetraodon nigroviridis]